LNFLPVHRQNFIYVEIPSEQSSDRQTLAQPAQNLGANRLTSSEYRYFVLARYASNLGGMAPLPTSMSPEREEFCHNSPSGVAFNI